MWGAISTSIHLVLAKTSTDLLAQLFASQGVLLVPYVFYAPVHFPDHMLDHGLLHNSGCFPMERYNKMVKG
jgi:hypothetical protein